MRELETSVTPEEAVETTKEFIAEIIESLTCEELKKICELDSYDALHTMCVDHPLIFRHFENNKFSIEDVNNVIKIIEYFIEIDSMIDKNEIIEYFTDNYLSEEHENTVVNTYIEDKDKFIQFLMTIVNPYGVKILLKYMDERYDKSKIEHDTYEQRLVCECGTNYSLRDYNGNDIRLKNGCCKICGRCCSTWELKSGRETFLIKISKKKNRFWPGDKIIKERVSLGYVWTDKSQIDFSEQFKSKKKSKTIKKPAGKKTILHN